MLLDVQLGHPDSQKRKKRHSIIMIMQSIITWIISKTCNGRFICRQFVIRPGVRQTTFGIILWPVALWPPSRQDDTCV